MDEGSLAHIRSRLAERGERQTRATSQRGERRLATVCRWFHISIRTTVFLLMFSSVYAENLIRLYHIENKLGYQWHVAPDHFACCNS
jgi:hypothetical protein